MRRFLRLGAHVLGRAGLVCLPLVLTASLSAEADSAAGREADRNAWLNSLVGSVGGPGGAPEDVAPGTAVLPSDGDLQVLVLTQDGGDQDPSSVVPAGPGGDTGATSALAGSGIPVRVLQAYVAAERTMAGQAPRCHLDWSLLAGIGRVESNHARYGGAGIDPDGRVAPPIVGPRLDGSTPGWATVRDTDRGRYDGDRAFDHAVGPMQFLPGTWAVYGRDADGNGTVDPQDVDDSALAAARYLCAGGEDLSTQQGRWNAVYRYNRSVGYVRLVLGLADSYASGRAQPLPTPRPGPTEPLPEPPASPRRPAPAQRPEPTPSAKPNAKPKPSATPSAKKPSAKKPSAKPTPTSGATPTPTPTASVSPTPTPTDSATPTPSPTGSTTPTPSPTGSTTSTPSPTDSPSPTPTDSPTPMDSASPTGSATPTPTDSATPSPTGTPSDASS